MKGPKEMPTIKLAGKEGDGFAIIGRVSGALRKAEADKEYIDKYISESMSGDYDHLLGVAMEYVNVI